MTERIHSKETTVMCEPTKQCASKQQRIGLSSAMTDDIMSVMRPHVDELTDTIGCRYCAMLVVYDALLGCSAIMGSTLIPETADKQKLLDMINEALLFVNDKLSGE